MKLFLSLSLVCLAFLAQAQVTPITISSFVVTNSPTGVKAKWTTAQESNNAYFEFLASKDGKTYVSLGKVLPLTANGNSSVSQTYSFSYNYSVIAGVSILMGICLVMLGLGLYFKKLRYLPLGLLGIGLIVMVSCKKSSSKPVTYNTYSIFQLKQVDKDGTATLYFPTN